jgi:hypothetical protein
MTYATESAKYGRIPTVFVELDMDFCALRSGIGACTATETGDAKCYNTYSTCNDTAHFDKIVKTYVFSEQNADLPIGLSTIPLLKSVTFASQEITPGKGLGVRGSVTAKFLDAPFPDTEIDPYWKERTYDTTNSGTFLGKFKARNPYYENRVFRVRRGYLTPVFDWGNFVDSVYIIDQLNGISKNDDWTVVARDILKLADDKKALFPVPSAGQLSVDISAYSTSITLKPSGVGSTYAASGKVAISGEVMSFTRSGDVLTVTRAQSNTIAAAHTAGDTVQQVGIFTKEKIHDVIYTLLTNAGINCSLYVDYSAWNTEAIDYLAGVWSAEIAEPTGINTLLGELTEQGLCRIWWDELAQQIKFRAVKPLPSGLSTLTDSSNFLTKSIDVKTDTSQRLSTILIYFAQKKPTEKLDDLKNYELRVVTSDTDASGALKYGTNPIKKIFSRWFKKTSLGRVNALSDSLLKTNLNPPRIIEFNLTPALQLKVGDMFYANTRKIQGLSGVNIDVPMEVVYAQPTDKDDIKYKAQEVSTAIPLSNIYVIYISKDDFDLNLYNVFVDEYGTPDAGIIVNFIIESGVLISASSTANYALTNPNTWPSSCTVTLTIESGAYVVGRGGNGGRGGRAFYIEPPVGGYNAFYGNGVNGGKGGNAISTSRALTIVNNGVISVGSGGGGGSGGAVATTTAYGRLQSGSGGGGGWPYGSGGLAGSIDYLDTATADYTVTYSPKTCEHQIGYAGDDAAIFPVTTGGAGGAARSNYGSSIFYAEMYASGDGGDYHQNNGANGGSAAASGTVYALPGSAGNGGAYGDYAVNGNSYVTWTVPGWRYGSIV